MGFKRSQKKECLLAKLREKKNEELRKAELCLTGLELPLIMVLLL